MEAGSAKLVDDNPVRPNPVHFFVDRWGYCNRPRGSQVGPRGPQMDFTASPLRSTEKGSCALHLPVLSKNQQLEPYLRWNISVACRTKGPASAGLGPGCRTARVEEDLVQA